MRTEEALAIEALWITAADLALHSHHTRLAGDEEHADELADKASAMTRLADRLGPSGDLMITEDSLEAVVYAESLDSGDKATAKAMSVAFRSALLQVLAIPTHDPDPDSQTYERASAPEPDPERAALRRAQHELLAACGGDKALAGRLWGDRTAITREELDELCDRAEQEKA